MFPSQSNQFFALRESFLKLSSQRISAQADNERRISQAMSEAKERENAAAYKEREHEAAYKEREAKLVERERRLAESEAEASAVREREKTEYICLICMVAPRAIALHPCGHKAYCASCFADPRVRSQSLCPICRAHVTETLRVID